MRRLLCLGLLLLACERTSRSDQDEAGASLKVPVPANILGHVSVASFDAAAKNLGAFVSAVKPGMGSMVSSNAASGFLAMAVGADSLSGVDWASPVHLVVLVPEAGAPPKVLLGVAVSDEKALRGAVGKAQVALESKRALLGADAAVKAARAWYFGSLAKRRAPTELTFTAYSANVKTAFAKDLDAAFANDMPSAEVAATMRRFVTTVLTESDELTVTLSGDATTAAVVMGVRPRAGTEMAQFAALQKVADPALANWVRSDASMVFVGNWNPGPYEQVLTEYAKSVAGAAWGEFMPVWKGRIAMGMDFPSMQGSSVVWPPDLAAASAALTSMAGKTSSTQSVNYGGIVSTFVGPKKLAWARGSAASFVTTQAVDPKHPMAAQMANNPMVKMPRTMVNATTADGDKVLIAMGETEAAVVAELATAGTKNVAPPADVAAALARGHARGESMFGTMDYGAMLGIMGVNGVRAPMEIGFGPREGQLTFRMQVAPATVKAIVDAASQAQRTMMQAGGATP